MKVSEALRRGIKLVPKQAFRAFFSWKGLRLEKACAYGTVYVGALGVPAPRATLPDFKQLSLLVDGLEDLVAHPVDGRPVVLKLAMQNLNDSGWGREKIAGWLEKQKL